MMKVVEHRSSSDEASVSHRPTRGLARNRDCTREPSSWFWRPDPQVVALTRLSGEDAVQIELDQGPYIGQVRSGRYRAVTSRRRIRLAVSWPKHSQSTRYRLSLIHI